MGVSSEAFVEGIRHQALWLKYGMLKLGLNRNKVRLVHNQPERDVVFFRWKKEPHFAEYGMYAFLIHIIQCMQYNIWFIDMFTCIQFICICMYIFINVSSLCR